MEFVHVPDKRNFKDQETVQGNHMQNVCTKRFSKMMVRMDIRNNGFELAFLNAALLAREPTCSDFQRIMKTRQKRNMPNKQKMTVPLHQNITSFQLPMDYLYDMEICSTLPANSRDEGTDKQKGN